jgi:hypothetical protein
VKLEASFEKRTANFSFCQLCRDMREMKNLLSKLRETMPLPLKNQGESWDFSLRQSMVNLEVASQKGSARVSHKVSKPS